MLKYRPSEIAASSFILAMRQLKKKNGDAPASSPWTKELEQATGMYDSDLQAIVDDVRGFVVEVNPKFLTTLKYKFSKTDYCEVATLPFKF